jgi:hypothetical protein
MKPSQKFITQLLIEWREGDETALDELMPLVYAELRQMAHRYMRGEQSGLDGCSASMSIPKDLPCKHEPSLQSFTYGCLFSAYAYPRYS